MDKTYTDKSFVKLTLNNRILRGNDKLHPANLENWRKIFAGNGETYVNKDGKTVKINSLIGIEIVEYDKKKESGNKTGRSLEYNLTPANISMIVKNIDRSLNFSGTLFSDVKTHAFVKNNAGKGEVLFFELKREAKMADGKPSRYPYVVTIKKGWAILSEEGVGYNKTTFEQDFYLSVRLSYADVCYFFDSIQYGIEIFRLVEGARLRRDGVAYEKKQAIAAAQAQQ